MITALLIVSVLGFLGFSARTYMNNADSASVAGWVEVGWPFYPRLAADCRSEIEIRDALETAESNVALWSRPSHRKEACYEQDRKQNLQKAQLCESELREILSFKVAT